MRLVIAILLPNFLLAARMGFGAPLQAILRGGGSHLTPNLAGEVGVSFDTNQALEQGRGLHQAGRLQEAEHCYRQILAVDPNHADGLHLLGVIAHQTGHNEAAVDLIGQAIARNSRVADFHCNLGSALHALGRVREAEAHYRRAIKLNPNHVESYNNFGNALKQRGQLDEAELCFRQAHQANMQASEGLLEWAEILDLLGRKDEAVQVRQHLCKLAPQSAKNWFELGLALQRALRHADARDAYLRAEEIDPGYPYLRNNLAAACLDLGEPGQALAILETLIGEPRCDALSLINMSIACRLTFQLTRSIEVLKQAIALDPKNPLAYSSYGLSLKELQRWGDATAMFEQALAADPSFVGARWNLAMMQLLCGNYAQGWISHEARWDGSPELRGKPRELGGPAWEGEPLAGKTLFVWGEQGFGDALQFARYVPLIAERVKREGGHMLYCSFGRLLPLFRRSFEGCFEVIVPDTFRPLPAFDYHCPLLSLPLRFGTTIETLPAQTPYLVLDENKVETWRQRLAGQRRLKVALVWTGNRTHQRNPFRSVSLDAYATAFKDLGDVAFYSLQFDAAQDIARAQANGFSIVDYTPEMTDYDDSAAFARNMDLIITICTSTAHLAGAIAAPTWLLLDVNPHWVWLTDRSDSPWYPTLTLYRQSNYREWEPVMARVKGDLAALAHRRNVDGRSSNLDR